MALTEMGIPIWLLKCNITANVKIKILPNLRYFHNCGIRGVTFLLFIIHVYCSRSGPATEAHYYTVLFLHLLYMMVPTQSPLMSTERLQSMRNSPVAVLSSCLTDAAAESLSEF